MWILENSQYSKNNIAKILQMICKYCEDIPLKSHYHLKGLFKGCKIILSEIFSNNLQNIPKIILQLFQNICINLKILWKRYFQKCRFHRKIPSLLILTQISSQVTEFIQDILNFCNFRFIKSFILVLGNKSGRLYLFQFRNWSFKNYYERVYYVSSIVSPLFTRKNVNSLDFRRFLMRILL